MEQEKKNGNGSPVFLSAGTHKKGASGNFLGYTGRSFHGTLEQGFPQPFALPFFINRLTSKNHCGDLAWHFPTP